MNGFIILLIISMSIVFCWCFMRCLFIENNDDRNEFRQSQNNGILQLSQFYRNQSWNSSINLEGTTYEIDRNIIKSLQEKYKIKINYNEYFNIKKIKKENQFCCICLQEYKIEENIVEMSCNHLFHYKCIQEWLNNNPTCPICREDVINERDSNNIVLDMSIV